MLDFHADRNGRELVRLSQRYAMPGFVKSASVDALRDGSELPRQAYADPINGFYPCHTKAATWLSAAYFFDRAVDCDPKTTGRISQRLREFADYWGIRNEVEKVAARADVLRKHAAEKPVETVEIGHRSFPVEDAKEVKAAVEALHAGRRDTPFAERHPVAVRLLEKAAAYGVKLGGLEEFLERQAGRGVCAPEEVVAAISARAKLADDAGFRDNLERLADSIDRQKRRFCHPDNLPKLAAVLDQVDRALGLHRGYGEILAPPEDILFATTFTKGAATVDRCLLTSGLAYTKDTLAKVALADVRALLGHDVADAVRKGVGVDPEKMAEVLPTLPLGDAELFDALMDECGLHPCAVKGASNTPTGLSDAEIEAWAGEFKS